MTAFIIVIASVFLIILVISAVCYKITFYSPEKNQNDHYNIPDLEQYKVYKDVVYSGISGLEKLPYEKVTAVSDDGLVLAGKYYHNSPDSPFAICCHGYRGTGVRDFSGGVNYLLSLGMNVLLIDERGHGESEGHTITFGVKEKDDCLKWTQYLINRFGNGTKILLYGISMGATAVLLTADRNLPENVKGIVADSPFTSPREIIKKVCGDRKVPASVGYPFIYLGARLFGRFNPDKTDASKSVVHTTVPILIFHGESDDFVPEEMSERIADANKEMISRYTFPGAAHGFGYIVDKPRYTAITGEFIEKIFNL